MPYSLLPNYLWVKILKQGFMKLENSLKNKEDYIDNQSEAVPSEEEKDRIMTMLIDWILTSRKLKPKLNVEKSVKIFWHWRLG